MKARPYQIAAEHCRESLGRHWQAPHSGVDQRTFKAFCEVVDIWLVADLPGRAAAVEAMTALLAVAQRHRGVHRTFALALAAIAGDHVLAELWPRLGGLELAAERTVTS